MRILVIGAHGRLGGRLVALLLSRGYSVCALVRRQSQADALSGLGVKAMVGDLRGDVEWAVDGCDAAIFAAGARGVRDLRAVDGGGAAKLADAADRYELRRFILCSAIGASRPERRRDGPLGEFLAAKHYAERRVARLDMPWTILRFGRLTEAPGNERIATVPGARAPLTLSRDDAALTVVEALTRGHLSRQVVHVVDGEDLRVAAALDAVEPRELPLVVPHGLAAGQSHNPPDDPAYLAADAAPLDTDVDFDGDGPLPLDLVVEEDESPLP